MTGEYNDDAILIITYMLEDGRRAFRCSASMSPAYQLLYQKLYNSSYKCVYEDFPWDHWVFEDKRDEESFMQLSEWFVIEEDGKWQAQ